MSKRFGRNQKRRMRAKLEEKQKQKVELEVSLRRTAMELDDAHAAVSVMRSHLRNVDHTEKDYMLPAYNLVGPDSATRLCANLKEARMMTTFYTRKKSDCIDIARLRAENLRRDLVLSLIKDFVKVIEYEENGKTSLIASIVFDSSNGVYREGGDNE